MAIHLFTTTNLQGAREDDLARLVDSVDRSRADGVEVHHHILLQNCGPAELATRNARTGERCRLRATPGLLPLSAARNLLMKAALDERPFGNEDLVAFPDDDCWYTAGFLARLETVFRDRTNLDLLLCRVSLAPSCDQDGIGAVAPLTARQAVRLTMSNSLFVRGGLAARLGPFDPALGLGTPAQGGEDTDYAVRAFLAAREAGFVDRALVGHPPADRKAAIRYFHGAMIVIARYAVRRPALMRELARKLLVGLYFVARGKLPLRGFAGTLTDAAKAFGASLAPGSTAPVSNESAFRALSR